MRHHYDRVVSTHLMCTCLHGTGISNNIFVFCNLNFPLFLIFFPVYTLFSNSKKNSKTIYPYISLVQQTVLYFLATLAIASPGNEVSYKHSYISFRSSRSFQLMVTNVQAACFTCKSDKSVHTRGSCLLIGSSEATCSFGVGIFGLSSSSLQNSVKKYQKIPLTLCVSRQWQIQSAETFALS